MFTYFSFILSIEICTVSCFALSTPMTSEPAFAKEVAIADPMAPAKPITSAVLPSKAILTLTCQPKNIQINGTDSTQVV